MPIGPILAKAAGAAGKSKAFEHLSKIKTSQWKEMGKTFGAMSDFAKQGGVARFIGGTIGTIKTKIENQVLGMFSPVINEVTQFTADLLAEAEPLGTALGDLIGLLKDISIQIGDVNVSLLDLLLGFPLILKGLNALIAALTTQTIHEPYPYVPRGQAGSMGGTRESTGQQTIIDEGSGTAADYGGGYGGKLGGTQEF